jgi:hypothetical protein
LDAVARLSACCSLFVSVFGSVMDFALPLVRTANPFGHRRCSE